MISFVILLVMVLSLNAHAGQVLIYNAPYTYSPDIVKYAQSNQFIIGKYHKHNIKPVNSRGLPPLPTAVRRFNIAHHQSPVTIHQPLTTIHHSLTTNHHSLSSMIKHIILREAISRNGVYKQNKPKTLVLTLYYPLNIYALTPKQKVFLLAGLRHFKGEKLYIEGYTDCSGTKKYNNKLADKRAKAVVGFLNKHGFKAVKMPSFGKYHTLKTAKESRRVEIYAKK